MEKRPKENEIEYVDNINHFIKSNKSHFSGDNITLLQFIINLCIFGMIIILSSLSFYNFITLHRYLDNLHYMEHTQFNKNISNIQNQK